MFTRCTKSKIEKKIDDLLSQMTLEEKINMIHASSSFTSGGVERLGIPELVMSDGPHGVRMEHGRDWASDNRNDDFGTYLPVGVCLASTWNPDLGFQFGSVLGSEAKFRGKDVILGPGVNILRTPLNGRNFEYLGEDPYLTGEMAKYYIQGVQNQGIAACIKHFSANNQETDRHTINVEIDERTLHEIYFPAFKKGVQEANVYTLMGAYNKFRGQFCSHNEYLLNTVLKQEWGFRGVVISDWGAVNNTLEPLKNGLDIEMGSDLGMQGSRKYENFHTANPALEAVKKGEVDESIIDDKVRRILRLMFKIDKFGERTKGEYNTPEHQKVARKVAEEGIVLLKNNQILPLTKSEISKIAVIGANANRKMSNHGGSSQVKAKYEVTVLEGLKNYCQPEVEILYTPGYEITKDENINIELIEEAVKVAKECDIIIYSGGFIHGYSSNFEDNAYDGEAVDKKSMNLPFGQDILLKKISSVNPNIIVVLNSGGPVDMQQWEADVPAIIMAWYPGMEGGNALANIIFGNVNPSGKLPMTFPVKLSDSPAHSIGEYPGENGTVHYKEGIFVGYRYYDTYDTEPLYCFGHGLSYTQFAFQDIQVKRKGDEWLVIFSITNTGNMDGSETAQLYVSDEKSTVERPLKELKGFQKVFLQKGETKTVEMTLNMEDFQFFDPDTHQWTLEPGIFKIMIGSSSRTIVLSQDIEI